jgi:hypothetical protein
VLLCLLALALALAWWLLMATERYGRPFRAAAARVQGHLLEVLLYGAYPAVMLRALAAVIRACGRLSWSLLAPSLWFCLALWPVLAIAAALYAHQPVPVGQSVLLELRSAGASSWTLQAPPGLPVEIDGFTRPGGQARLWRLRPPVEGEFRLLLESGGQSLETTLWVGEGLRLLSSGRRPAGLRWLLEPFERPLPADCGVAEIRLDYPPRTLSWKGWSLPWWVVLLLAFLAWSWLLALVFPPGNRGSGRQPLSA